MLRVGRPDAVSVGDYWLANVVSFALTGELRAIRLMSAELLELWRGQRAVVPPLLSGGPRPPGCRAAQPLPDRGALNDEPFQPPA